MNIKFDPPLAPAGDENILVLFSPKFHWFGIDVCKAYIKKNQGAKIFGFHTGSKNQKREVEVALSQNLGRVWLLQQEEKYWLDETIPDYELRHIDEKYGYGTLGRIITSDRRIGRGFVSGGTCRPDNIGKRSVEAPESIPAKYATALMNAVEKMIDEAGPRLVFCYAAAASPAVALAQVCQLRAIPFTCLTPARVGNKYVIDTDYRGRLLPVAKKYALARGNEALLDQYIGEAQVLQKQFQRNPEQPEYVTRRNQSANKGALLGSLRVVKDCVMPTMAFGKKSDLNLRLRRSLHENKAQWRKKFINSKRFSSFPQNRKYIYFPLQVDPEASTMVLSPMHTHQLSVIEALAKSAPSEMILVVKEHFPMLGRRPAGFYKQISKMPRVVLVSPDLSGADLIKNASLVAVITGTAAWEAIRLKVPTIVLGESPYLCIKNGATFAPCLSGLALSIKNELEKPQVQNPEIELYLAALLSESFDLPSDLLWGNYTKASAEHKEKASAAIADWLDIRVEKG